MNVSLDVDKIENVELYNGFLKSSPKIVLKLKEQDYSADGPVLDNNKFTITWVCPICSYSNDLTIMSSQLKQMKETNNNLPVCNTCGVTCTYEILQNYLIKDDTVADRKNSIDLISYDGAQCPKCTFVNHPSMMNCEICGTMLVTSTNKSNTNSYLLAQRNSGELNVEFKTSEEFGKSIDWTIIKFSFRNGGHKIFCDCLKKNLDYHAVRNASKSDSIKSDSTITSHNKNFDALNLSNGIHGLTSKSIQQNREASLLLGKSVQDLDQLMSKAQDLISLSKKYQNILLKTNVNKVAIDQNFQLLYNSKTSIAKLNSILSDNSISKSINNSKIINALNLLKVGKPSLDTKSKMPMLYIDELSRNICDYITYENILDKNNGLITFYELYSLYNQARQINLITPEELFDAIGRFDYLKINLKVTQIFLSNKESKLDSNTKFVYVISKKDERTSVSTKLSKFVRENPGLSILKLQQLQFSMSFIILKTILDNLVYSGDLVIDTTLEGNTYWPNNILNPDFNKEFDSVSHDNDMIKTLGDRQIEEVSRIFKASGISTHNLASERFKELSDLTFL